MAAVSLTPYTFAQRFVGVAELPGPGSNPFVLAMLRLDASWPASDDVPWCSAFVNFVAWGLRLPRSKSLRARSWLTVGTPVAPVDARVDADVVILDRAAPPVPSPLILDAPGHVGFFAGYETMRDIVYILGGNQADQVSIQGYPRSKILGIRRLN
jgi:uncharacterized protein (TIGR02594 family)